MKKSLFWVFFVFVFFTINGNILAQDKYPERPVTMIIGYPGGSVIDLVARAMEDVFRKYTGKPLVIQNKPGSGGLVGGAEVANAKPDGYTIGFFAVTQSCPECLGKLKPATYSQNDVIPLVGITAQYAVFACNANAPYKSFKEFIAYAKKNPGTLKFGHTGVGNRYWMLGMAMAKEAGIDVIDIPYNGSGELVTALLGNHIDVAILVYGGLAHELLQSNKLRPLCAFEHNRIGDLPDVPTIREVVSEFKHGTSFVGVYVPKGTPQGVTVRLTEVMKQITEDSQFKERMKKLVMPIIYQDTKTFQAEMKLMKERTIDMLNEKGLI